MNGNANANLYSDVFAADLEAVLTHCEITSQITRARTLHTASGTHTLCLRYRPPGPSKTDDLDDPALCSGCAVAHNISQTQQPAPPPQLIRQRTQHHPSVRSYALAHYLGGSVFSESVYVKQRCPLMPTKIPLLQNYLPSFDYW